MSNATVNPLSVLLICHSYPPVLGGSEIEAQRVSQALIARGHRVQVVCAGGPPMPPVRDWVDPKGVPVRIYAGRWKGALKDVVFALRVAGMLLRRRNDYDVVYFLMQGLHLAAGLPVSRLLRKPIVMKISGSGVVPFMNKSIFGRLELAWLRKWAHSVMVLNEGMRQEAIDHGLPPEQLLWMPNPVDTDEFAPASEPDHAALRSAHGIPAGASVVFYCGRLAPEKRLDSLLAAFALALKQVPQSLLVLVGDGPTRADLEQQCQRLGIQENVRFVGAVNPAEVAPWLKVADVFALVSVLEGFPCALSEAMSSGVASLVSDIPANRQLIRDGEHGLLAPVGDSAAIAAAMVRLLSDPPLRMQMGQAARKSIQDNYSTSRIADRYESLFRSVTGNNSSAAKPTAPIQASNRLSMPAGNANTMHQGRDKRMTRMLYILPGLVPPGENTSRDKHTYLSEIAEGEILLPVWWRNSAEASAYLQPTFPVYRVGNFRYHQFPAFRLPAFLQRLDVFLFYLRRGWQLHRERKFDVIMAYGTNRPGFAAVVLKWITGAKMIVEIPGMPENAFRYDEPHPGAGSTIKRFFADRLLNFVGRRADCIKLLYPSQLRNYPRLARKKVAIFHDFIPVQTIRSAPDTEKYVLSVGYPWFTKGMDITIRAFRLIASQFPEYKLKLLGHFPDRAPLERLADGCPQIQFLIARPNDEALKIIGACSVYVLGSRTEGLPRVLQEAMAAQRPIVASAVGGVPHYLEHNKHALLCEPQNVEDLAEKMATLLRSSALRERLAFAGREKVMAEIDERAYVRHFDAMLQSVSNKEPVADRNDVQTASLAAQ